ncbi:MAG: site-2 protease family protein [Candidatus Caenarcaniphilales bacterium]|jgi:membrane-associated protease RseP (regulator of RpoE activity)|nr:site-2 protease family protein [Candidatus Caenarcaniphilales bacterium]
MDIFSVAISILTIAVLIIVHEFGHFLAARYYGFQTPVFGIGLPIGPGINLFKKWETQFKFYFALIGGFVAIPELGDETDHEELKKYDMKPMREFPVGQRAVVASAGIVFNILFAIIIAIVMAASVGLPKAVPNSKIAAFTSKESFAKKSGFLEGDKIVFVDNIVIDSAEKLQETIKNSKGKTITVIVERMVDKTPTVTAITLESPGAFGIVLGNDKVYEKYGLNPFMWVYKSIVFVGQNMLAMFLSVIGLFVALAHKVISLVLPGYGAAAADLGQVKGIVGIVQLISEDIKGNITLLYEFAILLSLNLAVINLLPIPALDGGHLVFMAYEAIAGKKACQKFQANAVQIGFVFLLGIIFLTTFNDLKNWLFG